ncbi:MAG: aldehyde dehydrogenase family protein [Microthrixaceae bacterium]
MGYGEIVGSVRAAFDRGDTRPAAWRRRQLEAMLTMLDEGSDELTGAIVEDLGRSAIEAFYADVGHARLAIRYLLKHFERWSRPRRVSPGMLARPGVAELLAEPLGVALVIAPWNYPVQLLVEPMAAAIAAGNAVVAKPSELSPRTGEVLSRLIRRHLDPAAVAVVEGGVPETTALLEERFDHVFFTGSTAVGRVVMAAAARHLTPVTLELGGKSPAIVAADADLAVAARRIAMGKFLNAGQTCIAPDYVLVERAAKDEFLDRLSAVVGGFYGPDPSRSPDFARIVNERHHDRLVGLLKDCGGQVVVGGDFDRESRYLAPTVVSDPTESSSIMSEEIFGPLLPVVGVDSIDEAVLKVNAGPKPLALYVFTESPATADGVLERTSSGGACVNHTVMHVLPDALPFGGVGDSGIGAYHGKAGFDTFTHYRSVLRKPTRPDPPLLYPPMSRMKERLVRLAFR